MGSIKGFLFSKWGMFAMGMVAGVIVDRRTGGKIAALIAKVPVVGPKAVG